MTGILGVLASGNAFKPITNTYVTGTGATETVPSGARNLTIEVWASGGYGGTGTGTGCSAQNGSGGGAGGYSRTVMSVAAQSGKTMTYSVGAIPTAGNPGNASSVVSGTLTIATMTCNGGAAGGIPSSTGGAGGNATGGTAVNTTGASGANGQSIGGSGFGGAGTVGINGTGGSGGRGGINAGNTGRTAGATGQVIFAYT